MTDRCVQLLRSLRDVEGVVGSFVWHKVNGLLVRDLPVYIGSAILNEVGPRIERIYEAFRGAGDELDGATLSYANYKLHLRELDPAYIAVLSGADVNAPTLKMAMHVVGRGVCAELEAATAPPTEAETQPASAGHRSAPADPRVRSAASTALGAAQGRAERAGERCGPQADGAEAAGQTVALIDGDAGAVATRVFVARDQLAQGGPENVAQRDVQVLVGVVPRVTAARFGTATQMHGHAVATGSLAATGRRFDNDVAPS